MRVHDLRGASQREASRARSLSSVPSEPCGMNARAPGGASNVHDLPRLALPLSLSLSLLLLAGCDADSAGPDVWRPAPGTTWQWQLEGKLDLSRKVQMYDLDLFNTSKADMATLRARGVVVICYFSAGSYEAWRPDAKEFPAAALGKKMKGWNEKWLDVRAPSIAAIMNRRLDLARDKGCDGVEPDNVDGFINKTGFPLTAADQLTYNRALAAAAHARGLSIGLKNDLDQVAQLVAHFDWALNEQCVQFKECHRLKPFILAGKAVFNVEYPPSTRTSVCPTAKQHKLDTLLKKWAVDAWAEACWE